MSHQFVESDEPSSSSSRRGKMVAYSAHIQEAMRYNKLSSSDYRLAMTIMDAVAKGLTEEKWRQEQHRIVSILINRLPDETLSHGDVANRYEQMVACFKDLFLWPW
jgi:hypothetical protein